MQRIVWWCLACLLFLLTILSCHVGLTLLSTYYDYFEWLRWLKFIGGILLLLLAFALGSGAALSAGLAEDFSSPSTDDTYDYHTISSDSDSDNNKYYGSHVQDTINRYF